MFEFIRRHQIWAIIIFGIVIFSFVIYGPSNVNMLDMAKGRQESGIKVNGKSVSEDEKILAQREVYLSFFRRYQEWPSGDAARRVDFNEEQETYTRLLMLAKIRELDIKVPDEAVASFIKELFGGSARFTPADYDRFIQTVIAQKNLSQNDFERWARNEVALQHLIGLFGSAGRLVSPQEAEYLYRQENQPVSVELARLSVSNYMAKVAVTPEAVARHYSNSMAMYRVPPRLQVAYVEFSASNHLAEVDKQMGGLTNINAQLDSLYQQRGTNYYKDEQGNPLPKEAAREVIRKEVRLMQALNMARARATAFASELFDAHKTSKDKELFSSLAQKLGLAVKETAPFDEREGPKDLKATEEFTSQAFRLTDEEPYTPAVMGEEAVYVLALRKRLPSDIQTFDQVREKAAEDYRRMEGSRMAREAGEKLRAAVTEGLEKGRTFEQVARENGVQPINLPPFTSSTRSLPGLDESINLSMVQRIVSQLGERKASPFIPTREGGMIVYVKSRLPVDNSKLQTEFPEFLTRVRQERQFAAFNDWFQKQLPQLQVPKAPAESTAR